MLRILHGLDVEPGTIHAHATRRERAAHDLRQLVEQDRPGGAGVHRPAAGREPDGYTRLDVLGGDDHRGAGEDDLGGTLNLHASAPARAAVTPHDLTDGRRDAAREEVFEGDPAHGVLEQIWIESVLLRADPHQRRRGERVALHPVHEKGERSEVVGTREVLVGSVALAVYAVERGLEATQRYLSLYSGLSERPASLFTTSMRPSDSSSSRECRISRLSSPRRRCQSVVEYRTPWGMAVRTLRIFPLVSSTSRVPSWPRRRAGWRRRPCVPSRRRLRGARRARAYRRAARAPVRGWGRALRREPPQGPS